MNKPTRLVATLIPQPIKPKVRHYRGIPPELADHDTSREQMAMAGVLVIEIESDGVTMIRFARSGQFAGDTWYQTVEEAQEQAKAEFGSVLSDWVSVPSDIEDVVEFGLTRQ